jgi:Holliday junction resolvase RusA-like endonuclease
VHASVYKEDSDETALWRADVQLEALKHQPSKPLRGPIRIYLMFTMKRPKRLFRRRDPEGEFECDAVCDVDNLMKLIMDELTKLAFWADDRQVYDARVMKYYAAKDGKPGCEVVLFAGEQ